MWSLEILTDISNRLAGQWHQKITLKWIVDHSYSLIHGLEKIDDLLNVSGVRNGIAEFPLVLEPCRIVSVFREVSGIDNISEHKFRIIFI